MHTPRSAESSHPGLRSSFKAIDLELQVQQQAEEIGRLQAALAAANPLAAEVRWARTCCLCLQLGLRLLPLFHARPSPGVGPRSWAVPQLITADGWGVPPASCMAGPHVLLHLPPWAARPSSAQTSAHTVAWREA